MANHHLPPKTPISFLQEQCAKKGITPKYDLMSIEGAVHEPTFVYRVTVGDITATGTGQSKKKAKHAAAKSILEILLSGQNVNANHENVDNMKPVTPSDPMAKESIPMLSPYDDGIPGNPVGALQEVCMSRRWPPPTYEVADEEGLPHERMFTMACIVKKYVEKGTGKSKKIAKRQAAYRMLEKLKELTVGEPQNTATVEDDDDDNILIGSSLRDAKLQSLTPSFSQKISQFYRNMKASPGETLKTLHSLSAPPNRLDCAQFLQNIANENNFDVTYVDVEERTRTTIFQESIPYVNRDLPVFDSKNVYKQQGPGRWRHRRV